MNSVPGQWPCEPHATTGAPDENRHRSTLSDTICIRLQTDTLRERMRGSDVFVYHGYSLMLLDGAWVKATPAFNHELCARFGVAPIEFDGRNDALLHSFTADGAQHMEYLRDRGAFDDLPLTEILVALRAHYGNFIEQPPPRSDLFA